jgi:DHA2 family multidrug resistance protein
MTAIVAGTVPAAPPAIRRSVLVAVVLTAVLEVLDSTIVNVALPHIMATFGITSDQVVWVLTSYIVASVAVMPLTGLFVRRFGRRRLITTAIFSFAAFSMLCGLARNIEMMVAFRIGQGLAGAFLIPLSQSILFDAFPREKRGQAIALFGLGVVVAPVLGPTIGALLTDHFSWRAVFYVNVPMAGFALTLLAGELPSKPVRRVHIDWLGLALMVTAIGALQMTLDLGESRDWFGSRLIQVAALTSALAGAVFVVRGWRLRAGIIDFDLLRDRSFAAANLTMLGFGLAMFGTIAVLPIFVQGLLGYPVVDAGLLFVPRGLAAGISMVVTGAVLMRRVDPRLLLLTGLVLLGLGNLGLAHLTLDAGFWDISRPSVLSGLGMGLFFVPMSTLAFQNVRRDQQDEASGLYGVARTIGASVGISIAGWQLASRTQFHWSVLVQDITPFRPEVAAWLAPLGLRADQPEAAARLAAAILPQAQMLAFQDVFSLTGWAAFAMIPLVALMRKPMMSAASGAHA